MKSIKFFAVASAIALLSTAGFTSCNQKNGPDGPGTYNGETVKTQFSISIPEIKTAGNPAAAPGVLRMPADKTQESGFLGMDNIVLKPFNTAVSGSAGSKVSAAVTTSDAPIGGNIAGLSAIPGSGEGSLLPLSTSTTKYKVYKDISIPLGTNHFLFYAHGTTSGSTVADKFTQGVLTAAGLDGNSVSGISFSPVPIYTSGDAQGAALCAYLTLIANANDGSATDGHTWATHTNEGIKQLHDDFITLQAGSATSVLAGMEDLYNSLDVYNESYKGAHGGTADAVVAAVMTAIADKIDFTGSTVGSKTAAWKTSPATAFAAYPKNIHLPDGAAAIAWNSTDKKFEVASTYEWAAANSASGKLDVAKITDYVFPSCIYYYANSGLKTATTTPLTDNAAAIAAMSEWSTVLTTYYNFTDNIYVNANTRSVVIADVIQYAVARLKTSVKAGGATILDSKSKAIDVAKLSMTAVLVGGQGPVAFDFTTAAAGTKILYDSVLTTGTYALANGTYTTENPTLLLQTKEDEKIRMAVEFLNNDQDFFGVDGKLIPKGTKFYVVAELDPTASFTGKVAAMGNYVFKQDYTTTVKLNLKDLTKAYNVIPDLRTPTLEFGFAVDLSWKAGHIYEIDIE